MDENRQVRGGTIIGNDMMSQEIDTIENMSADVK